jgi:hypothetical protein
VRLLAGLNIASKRLRQRGTDVLIDLRKIEHKGSFRMALAQLQNFPRMSRTMVASRSRKRWRCEVIALTNAAIVSSFRRIRRKIVTVVSISSAVMSYRLMNSGEPGSITLGMSINKKIEDCTISSSPVAWVQYRVIKGIVRSDSSSITLQRMGQVLDLPLHIVKMYLAKERSTSTNRQKM